MSLDENQAVQRRSKILTDICYRPFEGCWCFVETHQEMRKDKDQGGFRLAQTSKHEDYTHTRAA